ncbi:hypothetical protein [Bifidobacterium biavatii]|uniref:Phage protein n=1 Tax=Bifidobacterium biavatii DSM 23969 TaxID=1437608 RepID=A0A086ZU12_9BIFI|nr:hypothetical protein [Bifidobacterium biavatii]KFI50012.1 hypothetical protein BBIA_2145 [Bifidobacterium biavatii DSM 23969]
MPTKPQDHKPPKNTVRTITVMGVDLTIDPAVLEDYDMVEYLYDIQAAADGEENGMGVLSIVPFLRKLCGPAYPAMKRALTDPQTKRIELDKITEFITQVMEELNPNS